MARKVRPPVEGIISYISARGTECHLEGDHRRYRGVKVSHSPGRKTAAVFLSFLVGQHVRLHWGGFANLNIARVELLAYMPGDGPCVSRKPKVVQP